MGVAKFNIVFLLFLFFEVAFSCNLQGGQKEQKRIVDGSNANFEEVPYIVQIEKKINGKWTQFCAGTIVSKLIAVTSAECFKKSRRDGEGEFRVRSGAANAASGGQIHEIINRATSKSKEADDQRDILTVIEVRPAFRAKPIALSTKEPQVDTEAAVYGWGSEGSSSSPSNRLKKADLKIGSREECEEEYVSPTHKPVNKNVLCTQREDHGKGVCTYDEGGPLIVNKKLAGVILYAGFCGSQSVPALYANIAQFKSYIDQFLTPCKRWDEVK